MSRGQSSPTLTRRFWHNFRRAQRSDGSLQNQTAFPLFKEPVWRTIDLCPPSPLQSRLPMTVTQTISAAESDARRPRIRCGVIPSLSPVAPPPLVAPSAATIVVPSRPARAPTFRSAAAPRRWPAKQFGTESMSVIGVAVEKLPFRPN